VGGGMNLPRGEKDKGPLKKESAPAQTETVKMLRRKLAKAVNRKEADRKKYNEQQKRREKKLMTIINPSEE